MVPRAATPPPPTPRTWRTSGRSSEGASGRAAQEGQGQDGWRTQWFRSRLLSATPHQLLSRHVGPAWTAHTFFHPCSFPSCSRTHSLGRATQSPCRSGSASELSPRPPPSAGTSPGAGGQHTPTTEGVPRQLRGHYRDASSSTRSVLDTAVGKPRPRLRGGVLVCASMCAHTHTHTHTHTYPVHAHTTHALLARSQGTAHSPPGEHTLAKQ